MNRILPKLILHGGAGSLEGQIERRNAFHNSLLRITAATWQVLVDTDAHTAVMFGIRLLEDDPIFNAGLGSRIQSDGQIRMSAALMSGDTRKFSGVINVQNIEHPIDLAEMLSQERFMVLAGEPASEYARQKGFKYFNPETPARREELQRLQRGKSGTVGVVALDSKGSLVVGTSTGGVGCESPGRVSDTPTVAGNYASPLGAVSATGTGEQIVNIGAAARVVTLLDAGFSLQQAVDHTIGLGQELGYEFGIIALDHHGNMIAEKTCDEVFYARTDGSRIKTFFEDKPE